MNTHDVISATKLDGQWYHLDATWNDEEPHWEYFLLSDTGMSFSRSWDTRITT